MNKKTNRSMMRSRTRNAVERRTKPPTNWTHYLDLEVHFPEWLIGDLFHQQSLVLLYGARGKGKTFLALDWAASVAAGTAWLDWQIGAPGQVAYLLAERPEGLRRRLMGWVQYRKANEMRLHENFVAAQATYHLDEARDCAWLIESLKRFDNLRLLVIDPLASFMSGSENETRDMQQFIDGLRQVSAALNCSILIVHHEGKGNKKNNLGARGSSALEAGMDTVLYLTSGKDENDPLLLEVTKQREAKKTGKIYLNFKPIRGDGTGKAGDNDLGILPERAAPPKTAKPDKGQTRKKREIQAFEEAITLAIEGVQRAGEAAGVSAIADHLGEKYPGEDAGKLKSRLRTRLTAMENDGRLGRAENGAPIYHVIDRRLSKEMPAS